VTGWISIVEGIGAGVGAASILTRAGRKWFTKSIQSVVDKSVVEVLRRQDDFERRQTRRLDRIERKIDNGP
jgi:hypothetical protein